jgi:hypothetical protein
MPNKRGTCWTNREAGKAMARLRQLESKLRLSNLRDFLTLRRSADFAKWEERLRLAGLLE